MAALDDDGFSDDESEPDTISYEVRKCPCWQALAVTRSEVHMAHLSHISNTFGSLGQSATRGIVPLPFKSETCNVHPTSASTVVWSRLREAQAVMRCSVRCASMAQNACAGCGCDRWPTSGPGGGAGAAEAGGGGGMCGARPACLLCCISAAPQLPGRQGDGA